MSMLATSRRGIACPSDTPVTPDSVEPLTLQVLHGDEVGAVDLADLEALYDIGVVETSCEPRLVEEHVEETRASSSSC